MSDLTDFYTGLMAIQYHDKPKAKAEILLKANEIDSINSFISALAESFDLDNAVDDRLDKIGKLVGFAREVPFSKAKILFGFDGDATALGMADLFNTAIESAPFADLFTPDYTSSQLDNNTYRNFIKAKIAKNICHAVMVSDGESISLQDVIQSIFGGNATLFDNKNMTLTLEVGFDYPTDDLFLILQTDLLPSPQGVGYKIITGADINSFGFDDDASASGFGDLFDSSIGGSFATLYTY